MALKCLNYKQKRHGISGTTSPYHFIENSLYLCTVFSESMVYITRRETFNAAHRLYREDWTDEQNAEVFGKCANKYFHGHNFQLFVTIKGMPDEKTGFIMDLKLLSKIIKKYIVDVIDHSNLNVDVPFLKGKMPSIEIMVMEFWKILEEQLADFDCSLHCLKLIETENNYVEYYGE